MSFKDVQSFLLRHVRSPHCFPVDLLCTDFPWLEHTSYVSLRHRAFPGTRSPNISLSLFSFPQPLPTATDHLPPPTRNTPTCMSYSPKLEIQAIQIQKASLGSGNKVVSQIFLNPLFHFLGRSVTSVFLRQQTPVPVSPNSRRHISSSISALLPGPQTRMGLECSPFSPHL